MRIRETGQLVERVDAGHLEPVLDAIDAAAAGAPRVEEPPFFARQVRVVTERAGDVDPESIDDYVAGGGYATFEQALTRAPAALIDEITKSGLRGRGGAGYPTGLKWSTMAKAAGSPRYVVCNADEGDPGAFMDRSV